uniref:Uncharacterized protein n=1 Tax=Cannabis sativa TaxID=3483 RepID=A0A803PR05_CANSA
MLDGLNDGQNLEGGDEEEKAHCKNEEDDGAFVEDTTTVFIPQGRRRPLVLLSLGALLTLEAKLHHEDKVQRYPHIKGEGITPTTQLTKMVELPWGILRTTGPRQNFAGG